ncbi:MAG TPA: single-stranded-DNA-specific exonuclease RecJ, partial [Candidatus Paceibacterota bacterium]|nr:single-stranded-DNA-specific exonuclease RecJ [Candidatus Paceibacterota bacterium]
MAVDAQSILNFLLEKRGVKTPEAKATFLSPGFEKHTHNPFLLKDMDKAVERLCQALKNDERIAVFSDYDADGIPGAVIFKDFLDKVGAKNFEIYIPHRHDEGFGLNMSAIDEIADRGAKVLITIDCGIADVKEITYAKSKNIDVIITDHHEAHADIKDAYAVIDPKQNGCPYPDKNICGSGVAFKFISAFLQKYGTKFNVTSGWEKWLLDMVAIATLSDMVSLTGENRVLTHYGLLVMRKTPRVGLNALFEKLRIRKKYLTEDDIAFSITPRINAASRMGEPEQAFKLLSAGKLDDVEVLVKSLEHLNNERKGTVAALVKEVRKIVSERNAPDKKIIVAGNPHWRPSLLGLAANSFANEFSCPVFLWGRDGENMIKGSCRSGGGVSVFSLMQAVRPGVLVDFGGHSASGGFSVAEGSVHTLEQELSLALGGIAIGEEVEKDEYDMQLLPEDVSWQLYDALSALSPFGVGNKKPLFLFNDVKIRAARLFGKEKQHMEYE